MPLLRLIIDGPEPIAELVAAALFEAGVGGLEEQEGPRGARLIVYPDDPNHLRQLSSLVEALLAEAGCTAGEAAVMADEAPDLSREWLRHLGAVALGDSFFWQPVGDASSVPEGRSRLIFEPDVAFGAGTHPSTQLAAAAVERYCRRRPGCRVLDVGTGTGVLSIVAVKSGAAAARGTDIDPIAVASAQRNAALNAIQDRCEFDTSSLESIVERFDLVVANLELPVLKALAEPLSQRAAAAETLIVTGFLSECEGEVRALFGGRPLTAAGRKKAGDYALLAFRHTG